MLNILTSEYEVQVQQIKGKINQDNNPLMLEQVRSTLRLKFKRIDVSNEDDTDDEEIQKALVISQFKGRCNNCGKYGYKKQYCRRNGNNDKSNENTGNKGRFNGTCNYCNNFGHEQAYCFNKQRNEQVDFNGTCNYCNKFGHKQEDLRKKQREEQANIIEDKEAAEVVLTTFNDTALLHANKSITGDTFTKKTWIGDTRASCHMTNLADGMFQTTDINQQIKVGNRTKMTATKIDKWRGVIYQKYDTKKNIVLNKVKLVP